LKADVFLGVDIGGTNTKLALVSRRNRVVGHAMISTRASEGAKPLFVRIREALPPLLGSRRRLVAVGIGCAGLVDPKRGVVCSSPNLPTWRNTALSRIGASIFGVYTYIDNDANAAAYGEYHRGCGRSRGLLICITLGTGVGGGIVDRGEVFRGSRNFAGEIGHMTVNERGPRCKCGNRGCLEAYVGADALVRDLKRILKGKVRSGRRGGIRTPLTPETIAHAARSGNRAARAVFDNAAEHLGTAMASLINVLNPDTICVSGGVANEFDLIVDRIRAVVDERAFPESAKLVEIKRGLLGFNAATVGAALMAKSSAETYDR